MTDSRSLSFSVVISTYNRSHLLKNCLHSLEFQDYANFEIIVVVGPCTDDTEKVAREYGGRVRVAYCHDANLSRSRNIGIDAACGDIIAFIDDDSVADRRWLSDLAAAYASPEVGGAGGIVYDHTGRKLQYRFSVCTRYGRTEFLDAPPPEAATHPRADPFVYLQGTNASFRRDVLVAVGGFNEQISYFHDETDVCARAIDLGYKLLALDNAPVFHKYAASDKRDHERTVYHPYNIVRSQCIFVLQNGATHHSRPTLCWDLERFAEEVRNSGIHYYRTGRFAKESLDLFEKEVDLGLKDGLTTGYQDRQLRSFSSRTPTSFIQFPTRTPDVGAKLRVCFVSQEYPPGDYGGIGRFSYDLATGFAHLGHDVHVVTHADGPDRTDFEHGVWVHRLSSNQPIPVAASGDALQFNYRLIASNYREIDRLHGLAPISVVSAPLWMAEGALASCDTRFPTVTTLMTPMRSVVDLHASWKSNEHTQKLLLLEEVAYKNSEYIHAISSAIRDRIAEYYGPALNAQIVPLGAQDTATAVKRSRGNDGTVRILFVGRMERRKGIDIFLESARSVLEDFPNVEFQLVGKDTSNTELDGRTYREALRDDPTFPEDLKTRIQFAGAVSESDLASAYANADIFCLPSRYESFGLVLVEAMVFGVPVVAADIGGMSEIVRPGENGFLFRPEDPKSLAEALSKLISNPALRTRLGVRARADFEHRFALSAVVPKTIEFYREIFRRHNRASCTPEAVADRFSEIVKQIGPSQGADPKAIAYGLLDLEFPKVPQNSPAIAATAGGTRRRIGRTARRSYEAIRDIPVVGALARETALLWKTYRFAQHFLGARPAAYLAHPDLPPSSNVKQIFGDLSRAASDLAHVKSEIAHVRHMVECDVKFASVRRHEDLKNIGDTAEAVKHLDSKFDAFVSQIQSLREPKASNTDNIGARMEFIRQELMFEMRSLLGANAAVGSTDVVPTIRNHLALTAGNDLRLNVGCGHAEMDGYVNVDQRDLPNVDIVAEAGSVPLDPRSVVEVFSSHLIEHFSHQDLKRRILPHWFSLLRPGGKIRAITPDMEEMLSAYSKGEMKFDDLMTVTFGLQEYAGDFHFAMYSRDSIAKIFESAGFADVKYNFVARRNGLCFDMEIEATKPNNH